MIGKNNPFNLRYSKLNTWIGQNGQTRGFCDFQLVDYCIRAVAILVMRSYRKKGVLSIDEIIHRYAPPSENNTWKYVDYVCNAMSAFPWDIPTREEYPALLCAMSVYEGNPVSIDEIKRVLNAFKIVPYKKKK